MTQPPHQPGEPGQPEKPFAYPPPTDPFATGAQPPTSPAAPPSPAYPAPGYPQQGYPQPGYSPPDYQPPGYQPPGSPTPPGGYPTQPVSGDPTWPPTQGVPGDPTFVGPVPPAPPKKRRALLITAIVLGVAVLLCGGGGTTAWYFLVRNADGQGSESAVAATNDFLVAIFTEQDPAKAEQLVCSAARDRKAITSKINQIKDQAKDYKEPKYSWATPTVSEEGTDSARVAVKVRVVTADEKVAEQQLEILAIKKTGWFVCDVKAA